MNFQEIVNKLKELDMSVSKFAKNNFKNPIEGIGISEQVEQHGGEGKGDSWWSVKYFPDHDIYIRVDGWYQSYSGTDFGGWEDAVRQVTPQQKTITVYE